MKLTQERLKELLHYDSETGVFTWLDNRNHRIKVGSVAGWERGSYLRIEINGKPYSAHHLVWLYMMGCWPAQELDHIDGDGLNNRFQNLREASRSLNAQNMRKPKRGSVSGFLGVNRSGDQWRAQIFRDGKNHHLGLFDSQLTAHLAYVDAKRRYHPGCTL